MYVNERINILKAKKMFSNETFSKISKTKYIYN